MTRTSQQVSTEPGTRLRLLAATLIALSSLLHPVIALADSTGEHAPTATEADGTQFTNVADALVCDGVGATITANNQKQRFYNFGFSSIPPTANILGIQVHLRAKTGTGTGTKKNRKLQVDLSWNGGSNFTTGAGVGVLKTANLPTGTRPLKDFFLGGPSYLWGRAWTANEVGDDTSGPTVKRFRVRVLGREPGPASTPDQINLDCVAATVFYQLPGNPSLNVSKTASPNPVEPGRNLTYTITYSNNAPSGSTTATNVIVSDTIPANTTFVSASPAPTSAPAVGGTGVVTWNVGSLAAGGSGSVSLVVATSNALTTGSTILNSTYSVDSDQNAATPGNPVSTDVVNNILLSLTKSDSPDPVQPGGTIHYVLTYANAGTTAAAAPLTVSEAYDSNVAFDHSVPGPDSGTDDTWTIPSLAAGAQGTIDVYVTVASGLADGVLINNSADVSDANNNTASASAVTQVQNVRRLSLTKTGTPNPVAVGGTLTYTLAYQNVGTTTLTGVTITDAYDPNVTFSSATPAPTSGNNTWAIGTLVPSASGSITVATTVSTSIVNGILLHNDATIADDAGHTASASADTLANGACGDGIVTSPEQCDEGGALNGTPGSCCSSTCTFRANDSSCSDGNACTQTDTCQAGVCTGANPVVCTAADQCHTSGVCDQGTGVCSNPTAPNGTTCTDGDACTQTDTCQSGSCVGSNDVVCTASDQCHAAGTCNPMNGTCSNPAVSNGTPCTDGDACTQTDTCQAGSCAGSNDVVCTASDQCHVAGTCNPTNGTCSNPTAPNGTSCSDGNACTQTDTCQAGSCAGSNDVVCTASDQCHVAGTCNPTSGACSNPAAPNGTSCNDADACTTADACSGGTCLGGPALSCDDANGCTNDSCNPGSGCVHVNNNDPCSDGSECTTADACSGGTCVGGPPPNCNDGNVCTDDSCVPATGCAHEDNTASCDDANECTTADQCSGGSCHGGAPPSCDDGNTCTTDSCTAPTGCTHTGVASCCNVNTECNDTDLCTTNERCVDHACVTDPVVCNDGNGCTDDSCNPSNGCHFVDNSAPCDDGSACTTADTCAGGGCVGGPPPNCSDGNVCTDDTCVPATGCAHSDNTAPCDDGLFCDGADVCSGGTCTTHAGNPCPGPDGDDNCGESCDEGADNCQGIDPAGGLCRPAAGECDLADTCDGVNPTCPADSFKPASATCGDPTSSACTAPDTCNGLGACIPNDASAGTSCGDAGTTDCSAPDTCDGSGSCLPNDRPAGAACADDSEACTVDRCNASGACTHPAGNAGTLCRAASGQCDAVEYCDGTNTTCPSDSFAPAGSACASSVNTACSAPDSCDGNNHCRSNDAPAGTPCSDGDACTSADQCDGSGQCTTGPPTLCPACEFCDNLGGCTPVAQLSCEPGVAGRNVIVISNSATDASDRIVFRQKLANPSSKQDFGNPATGNTDYQLCIFDDEASPGEPQTLAYAVDLPHGSSWVQTATGFKDLAPTDNPALRAILRSGPAGRGLVKVRAKGSNLGLVPFNSGVFLSQSPNVTVVLAGDNAPKCYRTIFPRPWRKNLTRIYKDRD